MTYIGRLIPVFVFVCIMNLFLSGSLNNISGLIKQIIIVAAVTCITLVFYIGLVCWKCRVKPAILISKLLPTFLIALSTASSSAAFGTNIESCKKMGIDTKLINFGVSIGQVIFMPASAIMYFISSLCIGQSYGIEITDHLDHNINFNQYDSWHWQPLQFQVELYPVIQFYLPNWEFQLQELH